MTHPYGYQPSNPVPGPFGPAHGAPVPQPQFAAEPPLVQIGDITVTQSQVITPAGAFPLRGSVWSVTDGSHYTERTSQVGVILAILGFFLVCALSLLFLLMKDRQITGYIQVMVRGANGAHYTANIPAQSLSTMPTVSSQVAYAQSLAAAA